MFAASWQSITEAGGEIEVSRGTFVSDGKQDEELDTRSDKEHAAMRALHH